MSEDAGHGDDDDMMILAHLLRSLTVRPRPLSLVRSFSASLATRMKVIPVPVRNDNYAYLLVDTATSQAAAVDPYDVPKVQAAAEKAGVQIVANITTHHHVDHSGGNKASGISKSLHSCSVKD